MFKFLNKIKREDVTLIECVIFAISATLSYSLLLWIFNFAGVFSWGVVLIMLFGVVASACNSLIQNKMIMEDGSYKTKMIVCVLNFINIFVFWALIWNLAVQMKVDTFAFILLLLSLSLTIVRTISSIIILPNMVNNLKRLTKTKGDLKESAALFQNNFHASTLERKLAAKSMINAVFLVIIPAIVATVLLWCAFICMLIPLHVPIQLILFAVFVILFKVVLINVAKEFKGVLLSK